MNSEQLTKETIEIIQKNVKSRRLELGLSQGQLANIIGMKRQNIDGIENRSTGITISTLSRLSVGLNMPIKDLIS